MPQPQVRVLGSGFTTLHYDGKPIAWLEEFRDSGQSVRTGPAGTNYEAIYELGPLRRPKELVTGYILGPGTITASIRETWNKNVWEHLAGLRGAHSIIDVYERLRRNPSRVQCFSRIRSPNGQVRGKVFHGCVVEEIPDGEQVAIRSLSVLKNLTIVYTHSTPLT